MLQWHRCCWWLQLLHMQLLHGEGPTLLLAKGICAEVLCHHLATADSLLLLGSPRNMLLRHVES